MNNTSYKRILWERNQAFKEQDHRGQSKYDAKVILRKAARTAGLPCPRISGIYSTSTLDTYMKETGLFLDFVDASRADVKHLEGCRPFVKPYVDAMMARNLSAWTIHLRVAALASMFHCRMEDFEGVTLPLRRRADIKRTRSAATSTVQRFEGIRYQMIRDFITATGARRGGVAKLKKDALSVNAGGHLRVHLDEKGGKERDARVLPECEAFVRQVFDDSPGYGPAGDYLFPKGFIPAAMAVHCFRAEYAERLYRVLEQEGGYANGKMYYGRLDMKGKSWDKGILAEVSKNLGHNRLDVVPGSYFYTMKGDDDFE